MTTERPYRIHDDESTYSYSVHVINENTFPALDPRFRCDIIFQIPTTFRYPSTIHNKEAYTNKLFHKVLELNKQTIEDVKKWIDIERKTFMLIVPDNFEFSDRPSKAFLESVRAGTEQQYKRNPMKY